MSDLLTTKNKNENCHPMQLWCVEWRNATTVTRGCADVILCPDEEDGCFPLNDSDHDERWCCCKENFCNSSQRAPLLHVLSIFVLLFGFC
ncbi:unnamed protein product [Heligmosomoides polygyrus]|uniref:Plethodontid modulating factor n=1 Tax=Heligmosomoides polygyrus TaxID=6339 RepID=A0A183GFT8_HELPZ|nr:unnamed protein product [Heligmosomoides polygyrus]